MTWLFLACSTPPPPAALPGPCEVVAAAGGGADPLAFAQAALTTGRAEGDEGAYLLADQGARCALERDATSVPARRLLAHVRVQQHRFAEAAALAEPLARETNDPSTWIVLGDALLEQGQNDGAAMAYQRAADHRPGLVVFDRIAHLRWLEGDVEGAREAATWAVESGSAADPEPLAWALSALGWQKALAAEPAPELDAALSLVPGYAPALLARGRARLHEEGPAHDLPGGLADLRALPNNAEALRFLADHQPVNIPPGADRRTWADFVAPTRPAEALAAAEAELQVRRDPLTRITHAWALFHVERRDEARQEARDVLATGCPEPRLLHHAALILDDATLARRALAVGAGLTLGERNALRPLAARPE